MKFLKGEEKLQERFGPDVPTMHDDLVPKLGCTQCGGKEIGLIYSPQSNEDWQAQRQRPNLYATAKGA